MKRIVGFSGGADSQATLRWVRNMYGDGDTIALNTNAGGNEDCITEEFIDDYSRDVFPIVRVKALILDLGTCGTKPGRARDRRQEFKDTDELTFDRLAWIKGRFPSRKAQFCTEHLKLAPQRRWCEENLRANGIEFCRYVGVRRDESWARRCVKAYEWDGYFECGLHRPIAEWSKAQVFAFLAEHGERTNPLYEMGFGRVGCAPCINSTKDDIRLWVARRPENIDKVREWEKRNGRTFFGPCVPGKEINWVDEVVRWAQTERGGVQFSLPILEAVAESGVCVSKYGLCE